MNKKSQFAFPVKLASPAQRALQQAGIRTLKELNRLGEKELVALHGIGPNAMKAIKKAMEQQGLSFSKQK